MPSKLKLLVISHTFPPDSQVGGLRPARFCQYLPEFGIEPIVLTIREDYCPARDPSVTLPPGLQVQRTRILPTPLDFYGKLKRRLVSGKLEDESGLKSKAEFSSLDTPRGLKWHLHGLLRIPDDNWGWYYPALAEAKHIIREQKVDAVLSTSPPVIAHLIGRHLKKRFGLPWMIDFRDPWTHNIDVVKMPPWHERLSARLEADCVRRADIVICNTHRLQEMLVSEYQHLSGSKFITLTNGFADPVPTVGMSFAKENEVTALHLGTIYGERRIDKFASALMDLWQAGKLDPNLKVKFVGSTQSELVQAIEREVPELLRKDILQFIPRVPFNEGQRLLAGANLLLLFQGDHILQVPAKFYEYLRTGKPMFAVARQGALTDMIDESSVGKWAEPDDLEGMKCAFLEAIAMPEVSNTELSRRLGIFHYRALTEKLAFSIRRRVKANEFEPAPAQVL